MSAGHGQEKAEDLREVPRKPAKTAQMRVRLGADSGKGDQRRAGRPVGSKYIFDFDF
jgi:hypothetical protein